jgi:hypothetical protein
MLNRYEFLENYYDFYGMVNESHGINNNVRLITDFIIKELDKNLFILIKNKILILTDILNTIGDIRFNMSILRFNLTDNFNSGVSIFEITQNGLYTKIDFNILLTPEEIQKEQIIESKISELITHEFTHVIELYYTEMKKRVEKNKINIRESNSWKLSVRLKAHQKKYKKDFPEWVNFTHLFYSMLNHERRARIASLYNYLIHFNTKDRNELEKIVMNSPEWKNIEDIKKVKGQQNIYYFKKIYPDFNEVLSDFLVNVLNKPDTENTYIKYIEQLKLEANDMKNKLSGMIYEIISDKNNYIEEHFKYIDYSKYQSEL